MDEWIVLNGQMVGLSGCLSNLDIFYPRLSIEKEERTETFLLQRTSEIRFSIVLSSLIISGGEGMIF